MVNVINVRHAYLVITPAQRQAPAVNGHLILQVVPGLAQLMFFLAVLGDVIRFRTVNRVERVDGRETAVVAGHVIGTVLIIQADQHAVVNCSGIETAVDLVIQRDGIHLLVRTGIAAVEFGIVQPARGIYLIQRHFGVQIAQLLAHRPAAVEHVLNVVAHHVFPTIVLVVIILTFKEGVGDFLTVMRHHGAS